MRVGAKRERWGAETQKKNHRCCASVSELQVGDAAVTKHKHKEHKAVTVVVAVCASNCLLTASVAVVSLLLPRFLCKRLQL